MKALLSLLIFVSSLLTASGTLAETIEITASKDGYEVVRLPAHPVEPPILEEAEISDPVIYYTILSKASGNAVAVRMANKANGERVIEWKPRLSHEQQWRIVRAEDGWIQLHARHSKKALAIREGKTEAGADAIQWRPNPGGQMWKMEFDEDGAIRLINRISGHALSIGIPKGKQGRRLIQAERADTDDQKWLFQIAGLVE
jgi:hypothetical protein